MKKALAALGIAVAIVAFLQTWMAFRMHLTQDEVIECREMHNQLTEAIEHLQCRMDSVQKQHTWLFVTPCKNHK